MAAHHLTKHLRNNILLVALYVTLSLHQEHMVAEALPRKQIHQHMTIDELQSVFQVNNHKAVPEYQLIHIRSLHKRDTSSSSKNASATKEIHLSVFGRDFRLRLQRNDHLSKSADRLKMFMAEMHTDGNLNLTEVTFPGNTSDIGEVYQDDASGAAVILHHAQDGSILLDGTIGSNLAIKPAPPRFRDDVPPTTTAFPDDEMFMDNELPDGTEPENRFKESTWKWDAGSSSTSAPVDVRGMHIVYHRRPDENSHLSDYMFMEPDRLPLPEANVTNRQRRSSGRPRREAPEAVWPEILVIVDYDTYNMHGGNNMDIKRYFISFWNGVDLRYKLLGGPKVRISLAGIIISKGRDATPYLENNRVGGNAVDSAGALTELGKYLFRERRLPTYDIAVVVTKLDLCRREFTLGACNKGTAGFAYVGGACVVNKRLEKVNSVAIIEDTGGFSGIIVAAHEVGHLLGAVHDGSPPPSYLGGPGAEHCRWEDGYIMSDLRHTERGFKWSICSTQQFKHFLNGDTAKCLYNIPHEDDELPRLLPGKLLSLDAQCRKDRGTSACFKDDRVCAQLFCFDSRSGYCVSYRPAAEGSPCGDGQFCINGQCIAENENVIPDYSRVSEVVVPKPNDLQLPSNPNPALAKGPFDESSVPPRRTAILDTEEQEQEAPEGARKRTSVLDTDETEEPAIFRRTLEQKSDLGLKRTSVLDDMEAPVPDIRGPVAEPEEDTPHLRRTSHLDEIEQLASTARSAPNGVAKRGPTPSFEKVEESELFKHNRPRSVECDLVLADSGCRDIMRELAGGLTCKQFLRRFGDRYCNHHYIIANCCSSRKLICEV